MAYDKSKDPFYSSAPGGPSSYGASGAPITPSDSVDLTVYAKAITVTTAGTLKILPVKNDEAVPIAYGHCPIGFVPPYRVRRVFATGTTAAVATVDD